MISNLQADIIILKLTIDRLERDTWDDPQMGLSIEDQGELVRAQNRLARRLREALILKQKDFNQK